MGWHGPSGSCGCCFACDDCDSVTTFSISGLSDPAGCAGGCTQNEGTYIFRSGTTQVSECSWSACWLGSNCDLDDEPQLFIGERVVANGGCGPSGRNCSHWQIIFEADPGGVKVSLFFQIDYNLSSSITTPPTYNSARYTYEFSEVFPTCADAIGGTLTYRGVTKSQCQGTTDPGDQCGLAGATITLG